MSEAPPEKMARVANEPTIAPPKPSASIVPTIPLLVPSELIHLARTDADYNYVDLALAIADQTNLPLATYNQLTALRVVDLPINVDEFTRVWRTLLLKRAQDVYEKCHSTRPDHYVRITQQTLVPGPLSDLLYHIGSECNTNRGVWYVAAPPARDAQPPNWWTVDADVLSRWNITMASLSKQYLMRELPPAIDHKGRTIHYCARNVANDLVSVKSYTSSILPSDGLVTAVNDGLFGAAPFPYATNHITVVPGVSLASLRSRYVACYVLESNA